MAKRIHIVIAEPSAIIRCGIVTLLQRAETLNVDIAEISDISSILSSHSYKFTPDLLIINPSNLGLLSLSQLKSDIGNERLKIIALQNTFNEQSILQNYDEVISIFDSVETIKDKISDIIEKRDEVNKAKELSSREKEIIVSVVKGMTNKQIADSLYLSTHTVIAHRRNIASKLQIHSPSGLTIYAIVNKLVDLASIKNSIYQNKEEE
ncbi:MAG: LuxR C-terminal-related transcriptional regulator [Rikenellaceae bacterium]